MARHAAKGVNERLHVVITRRVSLDRVYEGRDVQRVACIGYGAGVHARSRQNERKKSCSRRQRGQADVSSLRDHREARSSRSSCVRTGRDEERNFMAPPPLPSTEVYRLASLEELTASLSFA